MDLALAVGAMTGRLDGMVRTSLQMIMVGGDTVMMTMIPIVRTVIAFNLQVTRSRPVGRR
jgi:hypothetical protein